MIFLLFTGLRVSEATSLEWRQVDLLNGFITIAKTKNGRQLKIPVCSQVWALLERRNRITGSPFVFPSRNGKRPFAYSTQSRYLSYKTGIKVTAHGLRRTFSVTAAALRIERPVIKRLLNHYDGDVTSIYAIYEAETLRTPVNDIADSLCTIGNVDWL